ncbi:MAG: endo-1,4-beta-xylanase [Lachnospiraceae bacterium]|nr:endo-1,4-beta-xylanase [Lachnospiraceae bacterium]
MLGLKEKYRDYFKIGACVSPRTIVTHADLLKKHFNSLTCENAMKYVSLCREPGKYTFDAADRIYQFAKDNDMAVHGHTFVWHNQTPDFIFDTESPEETMRAHMKLVAERYGAQCNAWDVANECIEDKSDAYYRNTKWYQAYGENYLDRFFVMARELLPKHIKLYYNDYNEAHPLKREKIYQLVKGMKERGVPVDGIGMQSHHNLYVPGIEDIRRAIERYAELGVTLQVTEMDVSVFAFEDRSSIPAPTKELMERQAEFYERCFEIYREYKGIIESVTLWGIADDVTWLDGFPVPGRKNWPLLFDVNHQPKEAFHRIMNF